MPFSDNEAFYWITSMARGVMFSFVRNFSLGCTDKDHCIYLYGHSVSQAFVSEIGLFNREFRSLSAVNTVFSS